MISSESDIIQMYMAPLRARGYRKRYCYLDGQSVQRHSSLCNKLKDTPWLDQDPRGLSSKVRESRRERRAESAGPYTVYLMRPARGDDNDAIHSLLRSLRAVAFRRPPSDQWEFQKMQ